MAISKAYSARPGEEILANRRNLAKIRRLRTVANGYNFSVDMGKKRYRCFPDLGEPTSEAHHDGIEGDFCVGAQHSEKFNSEMRLLRSVSAPCETMDRKLPSPCESSVIEKSTDEQGQEIEPPSVSLVIEQSASPVKPQVSEKQSDNTKNIFRANSDSLSVLAKDCCPPHGMMSVIGRRSAMEDTVAVVPSFYSERPKSESESFSAFHFFGVYDGHGGSQASEFCRQQLHEVLADELRELSVSQMENCYRDVDQWNKAMTNCFIKIDIKVGGACPSGNCSFDDENTYSTCCGQPVAPENVGSTAVVAVVSPSQIVVANCGDSRAVLSRGGKTILLSNDHKPEREDEMVRIEAAGGHIVDWNGYRVGGFLAMSRAIGDRFLKEYIISEPEVTCTERTEEDEFLILASDGLWDVISNEDVCDVARRFLAGYRPHLSKDNHNNVSGAAAAAARLTKLALARGSTDNISVVVIDLKRERQRNRCKSSNSIKQTANASPC